MFSSSKLKLFIDSADLELISKIDFIKIDGITTNPSLAAKSIKSSNINDKFLAYKEILKNLADKVEGDISGEVIATDFETMKKEALEISEIVNVVKLPTTRDGLRLCKFLVDKHNISVNMTLCFSPTQATLCAINGAKYVSPFVGRLDDIGLDGLNLIRDIKKIYENYKFETKILAASVRNINHIIELLKIGVDVITMSPTLLNLLYEHILTNKGLEIFLNDWNKDF